MSIIHDALKKVQESNPSMDKKTSVTENNQPAPSHIEPRIKINIPVFIGCICAVLAMILAPRIFVALTQQKPIIKSNTTATPPATPINAPILAAKTATQAAQNAIKGAWQALPSPLLMTTTPPSDTTNTSEGGFHIEGILEMNGKKAVLVNGEVYEEGQLIQGKKIISITFNSLTIDDNGLTRTIAIKP